jgi:uncharacterized Zn finger protein
VSRENAMQKGLRYLAQARVRILEAHEDEGLLSAEVRGNGSIYIVCHEPEMGWSCTCPAKTIACAHVLACQQVVVFEPREVDRG